MSQNSTTAQQFSSWISKERWAPLLTWFNQNDSKQEHWELLFAKAKLYDLQKKWPQYLAFFQQHLDHKNHTGIPDTNKSLKLLSIAMPLFFVPAIPFLSLQQRQDLKEKTMEWFCPCLPAFNGSQDVLHRHALSTVFRILTNLDALSEWKTIQGLVYKKDIPGLIQHTKGQNISWVHALRDLHFSYAGNVGDWRVSLFEADCIEHILADKNYLGVAKTFLAKVDAEPKTMTTKLDDQLNQVFKRYPHFRIWTEQGTGNDAQTCRAILGVSEIEPSLCSSAKAIQIGKSLGLSLTELAGLLEPPVVAAIEMNVDGEVFADGPLA